MAIAVYYFVELASIVGGAQPQTFTTPNASISSNLTAKPIPTWNPVPIGIREVRPLLDWKTAIIIALIVCGTLFAMVCMCCYYGVLCCRLGADCCPNTIRAFYDAFATPEQQAAAATTSCILTDDERKMEADLGGHYSV